MIRTETTYEPRFRARENRDRLAAGQPVLSPHGSGPDACRTDAYATGPTTCCIAPRTTRSRTSEDRRLDHLVAESRPDNTALPVEEASGASCVSAASPTASSGSLLGLSRQRFSGPGTPGTSLGLLALAPSVAKEAQAAGFGPITDS